MDQFALQELDQVRRIVLDGLKGCRAHVFLFGSRARGDARRWSDVDVAIDAIDSLPAGQFMNIVEALEESDVVFPVDLVDLSTTSREFRAEVEREGIPWTA